MMFKFSLEACTAPLISFIFIFGEVEVSSKVGKSFTRWEARTVIAGGSSLRKCKMSKSVLFGRGKIKMRSKFKKSRRLYFLVCNLFREKGGGYEQEKISTIVARWSGEEGVGRVTKKWHCPGLTLRGSPPSPAIWSWKISKYATICKYAPFSPLAGCWHGEPRCPLFALHGLMHKFDLNNLFRKSCRWLYDRPYHVNVIYEHEKS